MHSKYFVEYSNLFIVLKETFEMMNFMHYPHRIKKSLQPVLLFGPLYDSRYNRGVYEVFCALESFCHLHARVRSTRLIFQ